MIAESSFGRQSLAPFPTKARRLKARSIVQRAYEKPMYSWIVCRIYGVWGTGNRAAARTMLRHAVPVAALILLTGAATPLLPGVNANDRRMEVNPLDAPWNSLGRVQAAGMRCTGFLVDRQTVMTAAHCLMNKATDKLLPPQALHFVLGYNRGAYKGHSRVARYRTGDWASNRQPPNDWAVLTLEQPLGSASAIAQVATQEPAAGERLVLAGYGRDRAEILFADLACRVLGLGNDAAGRRVIEHNCAGTYGTSGAPLFYQKDGVWQVVAIQVAAAPNHAGGIGAPFRNWADALPLQR